MEKEEVCCPKFNPEPWDEKEIIFKDKLFVKSSAPQIFHIPIPWVYGKIITRTRALIEEQKASDKDFIMLSSEKSPWKSDLFFSVAKEVPGAENVKMSGTFMSKVFDGPYNNVPKWIKETEEYVDARGEEVKDYYLYYTTCPKCAKKYGHNYVVVFAQV